MRTKSATEENTAAGIVCTTPWRLTNVKLLANYELEVEFNDGLRGVVEMVNLIMGDKAGVFTLLKDREFFNKVYIEHGVLTWPGEIDLAPDTMYDAIKQNGRWILQ